MQFIKKILSYFIFSLFLINGLTACANINQMNASTGKPYQSSAQTQKMIYSLPDEDVWNPRSQPLHAIFPRTSSFSPYAASLVALPSPLYTENGYFPYNEFPQNWTQVITEEFYSDKYFSRTGQKPPSLQQFVLADEKQWSQYCQTKDWKLTQATDASIIESFHAQDCDPVFLKQIVETQEESVYVAAKIFRGADGLYALTYMGLPSVWSPTMEKQVMKMLANAHLE